MAQIFKGRKERTTQTGQAVCRPRRGQLQAGLASPGAVREPEDDSPGAAGRGQWAEAVPASASAPHPQVRAGSHLRGKEGWGGQSCACPALGKAVRAGTLRTQLGRQRPWSALYTHRVNAGTNSHKCSGSFYSHLKPTFKTGLSLGKKKKKAKTEPRKWGHFTVPRNLPLGLPGLWPGFRGQP